MNAIEQQIDILKGGTNVLMHHRWDERAKCDVPDSINWETFCTIGAAATAADGIGRTVVVTSAAIARGMLATRTKIRPDKTTKMHELQRQSVIGWRYIQNDWAEATRDHEIGPMQLTRHELQPAALADEPDSDIQKQEREEALRAIHTLLAHREVPLINENDAVSHDDITFGDNDILAALLAVNIVRSPRFTGGARLFLLSDTNGIYADKDDPATRIPVIDDTSEYSHLAIDTDSSNGTGGPASKFKAAEIVNAAGIDMWVYDPRGGNHQNRAVNGYIGTYFPAKTGALACSSQILK